MTRRDDLAPDPQDARVAALVEALRWYSDDPSSQGDVARAALAALSPTGGKD